MKTLLIITDGLWRPAGTERAVATLINMLGGDFKIIVAVPNSTEIFFDINEQFEIRSLEIGDVPPGMKKINWLINAIQKLSYMNQTIKPDFVLSTVYVFNIITSLIFKNSKNLLCEHINYHYHGKIRSIIRKFFYAKNNNAVICLTEKDKLLHENNGCRAIVITNAAPMITDVPPSEIRDKTILAVGRFEYQKGFDRLIDAFHLSGVYNHGWRLKIVGEGSLKENIKTRAQDIGVKDFIDFVGNTKDMASIYSKSSFFVMSSHFEAFPMVLLEAASYALPLISFDCETGPKEIIGDSGAGILIPQNDIKGLAEAIKLTSLDNAFRAEMSLKSEFIVNRYSPASIKKKWLKVLR
ncbi:glycosyltransferase [Chromobacterium amazonense]|uniref:glycosyltransferase n=1 Tax=Chromobacterium amazonense TaxID=1382803 RepID=UPI00237ED4DA|nr:glycosyltransferase [Chromobacterium amazonense]MDE1716458.1 glycosyltransferase [Chromobacterium amazonense]